MTREQTLDEAKKCVCGQRQEDYGTPENNFQMIADLWNVYLSANQNRKINAVDVAHMMTLMKIARLMSGKFKKDSYIDACGYMACGCEIASKEVVDGGK